MSFLMPKKPPPPSKYSPDLTEPADVAVPLGADGGETVRDRMAQNRRRQGRSALQIPRSGTTNGLAIPKQM